ncbi:MAG: alternate F1F0 ATPase, F1 subunit alpha [Gracilimonas sp.]|uniref:alternate F1F0 ATPase, F1 subunit alpha n=1 Tax=Gracilimonas sp. TaxID=1974203 RepID=UPI0019B695EB|nr:alternate F1F0 ATPase, F1 subunit alpha [Gracilimonas sp.]MBD3616305.1 alternate F1F0 ATPase, F1 subunit alpha [Gracilimonas sp.]
MNDQLFISAASKAILGFEEILKQEKQLQFREYGKVISVGEGFARVAGLPNVGIDELVWFESGCPGLVYNLDEDEIGIILLGEEQDIEAGHEVYRSGKIVEIPVGEELIGRVIDPLGRVLDGRKPLLGKQKYPIERPAPPIIQRAPVERPLQTGIKVIDALFPIGRGQRELILGDRQTGKTTIAVDTIINQQDTEMICIYCAIGKQNAATARVIKDLRAKAAMKYSIVVSASSDSPVGLQYIAPYAATSIGEFFMEQGKDVLIVYDDLTWHARAYRELALLLRRPPGREAYPGDIFYIHSRLLERSTHLKSLYGGGSMTALPIVETQAQNISAFIPTNLISITDGQLYLSPVLFQKDVLPAVDTGKSVSRVGSNAQLPAYRSVTKKLRLAYAQFEELEAFSRFSSRLDEETQKVIRRGRLIREILKQPQLQPIKVEEQMVLLLAATSNLLDVFPPGNIPELKEQIRQRVKVISDEINHRMNWEDYLKEEDREFLLNIVRPLISQKKEEG